MEFEKGMYDYEEKTVDVGMCIVSEYDDNSVFRRDK